MVAGTAIKTYLSLVTGIGARTPTPNRRTAQSIVALIVLSKSTLNSFIKSGIAGPRPPIDQPAARERKEDEINATFFFHRGELWGSLESFVGCGIRTISEPIFFNDCDSDVSRSEKPTIVQQFYSALSCIELSQSAKLDHLDGDKREIRRRSIGKLTSRGTV